MAREYGKPVRFRRCPRNGSRVEPASAGWKIRHPLRDTREGDAGGTLEVHSKARRPACRTSPASRRANGRDCAVRAPPDHHPPRRWPITVPAGVHGGSDDASISLPFVLAGNAGMRCPGGSGGVCRRRPGCRRRAGQRRTGRHRHADAVARERSARVHDPDRPRRDRLERRERPWRHPEVSRRPRPRAQRRSGTNHRGIHPRRQQQPDAGNGGRSAHQPGNDRAGRPAEHQPIVHRTHRGRKRPAICPLGHGCDRRRDQRHHASRDHRSVDRRNRLRRLRHRTGQPQRRHVAGACATRPRRGLDRQPGIPDAQRRRRRSRLPQPERHGYACAATWARRTWR